MYSILHRTWILVLKIVVTRYTGYVGYKFLKYFMIRVVYIFDKNMAGNYWENDLVSDWVHCGVFIFLHIYKNNCNGIYYMI